MTTQTAEPICAFVPKLWPGETVVCIGAGPSLTAEDVAYCRGRARVIAIKEALRLAPWADLLYACDSKWWKYYGPALSFEGPRYALEPEAEPWARVLRNTGMTGLELDPSGVRTGKNSGFQVVNIALHLGAARIVLLGYDMQPAKDQHRWFGKHPYQSFDPPYREFLDCFDTIVEPLKALGVQVVNATRRTALRAFQCVSLEEALA